MEQFSIGFEEVREEDGEKEPATKPTAGKLAVEQPTASLEPHILTVSELTAQVKQLVDSNFLDVWVVGEVSNYRGQSRRHYYFTLKDEDSQLNAVVFNGASRVRFDLVDGLELVCHGNITVYGPRGQYQIIIDECFPKGKGALQLAFEQLKAKLEGEGLFAKEHKKQLPYLPKRIGVVTSPTGAAVRDIVHVLTRRYPPIEVLLYPVRVQGDGAAEEVAHAIARLNGRDDIDVLIVGRGGGSLEDLWAFNEEVAARAIFASRIPVISAVGHEIDFTIADFVADVRAPTPSAAAEIAVPVMDDLKRAIKDRRRQLVVALQNKILHDEKTLTGFKERIPDPRRMIPDYMMRVDGYRERLTFSAKVMMERYHKSIEAYLDNLRHLSPFHILEKGYAMVQKEDGAVVKDAGALAVGDAIEITFHRGRAKAKVL